MVEANNWLKAAEAKSQGITDTFKCIYKTDNTSTTIKLRP